MVVIGMGLYPDRVCETCTAAKKIVWGCDEDVLIPIQIDDEKFFRCPLRPYFDDAPWVQRILYFYRFFKDHQYPDAGTFLDQSSRYLTLMEIVTAAVMKVDAEKDRRRGNK